MSAAEKKKTTKAETSKVQLFYRIEHETEACPLGKRFPCGYGKGYPKSFVKALRRMRACPDFRLGVYRHLLIVEQAASPGFRFRRRTGSR